jgi:hypothetical protein
VAPRLLGHLRKDTIVLADKAYGADWLRRQIEAVGAAPNIPPMDHRRWKPCFSPVLYRGRNRMNGSSTASNTSDASLPATKSTPQTSLPCSSWLPPDSGCAIVEICDLKGNAVL